MNLSNRIHRWVERNHLPISVSVWFAALVLMVLLALIATRTHAAPSVTLTASPTTAISPASVTLTWSGTEVNACVASGGWTGTKGVSGSQTITGLTAPASFTLTCTGATEPAVLSWTPPVLNTDGSVIPATGPGSLAKYKVYHAATAAAVATATAIEVPAPASTYTINGLPTGPRYFALRASTEAGVDSDLSATVTKTTAAASASATAAVTVNTKPAAPLLTVATTAYELRALKGGTFQFVAVGTVPLGAACGVPLVGTYTQFDGATLTKATQGGIIAARCRAAT